MVRVNGYEVPFGLKKIGTKEKDNPNVYNIHDQVCKRPYAREIKFIKLSSFGVGFKNNANHQTSNRFQEEFSRLEACKLFQEMLKLLDMFG